MRAIILLLSAALCCGSVQALVPHQINYQGYLTNPGGTPVNASVTMVLNLYNVPTGGAALYTETQMVTVTNGVFNVLIGSVTPLALPFDVPYYLGIMVGADPEMTPRQPVAASAYAIRSATTEALAAGATVLASQVTGTVGSATSFTGNLAGDVTGTQGATAIAASTVTGKALTGFASGAGNLAATDTVLTAINKLDGNVAAKAPLASPLFTGNVGIGATSPGSKLTVAGLIESTSGGIKFPDGTIQTTGTTAVVEFGSFFGMTAGPGNIGVNDYPATIAISAAGPSVAAGSALNFPRASAPAVGGIAINNPGPTQTDNTEFILPSVGTYRVTWHISVDEPAQWSLWINTAPNPGGGGLFSEVSAASGAPASVGHSAGSAQLVGDVVFRNSVANSAIQSRNYAAPTSVTVTTVPGGTRAQAVSLIIQRLQ
ncbi:MAG: hypothetical protein IPI73_26340 [Betaproteobacteria bacterium]|nr:hypothetical protein [Betaproteobacteria bacterium]